MSYDHRILVVDDEVGPREALRMMLKSRSQVMTASSGPQALDLICQAAPDLVLLDIKMSGMNGIEVLKAIKQIDASIEVIIMTAYASLDTARQAVAYQASEYLVKPFSKAEVEKAVDKALAHRAERASSRQEIRLLLDQLRTLSQVAPGEGDAQQILDNTVEILEQSRQAMHATVVLFEQRAAGRVPGGTQGLFVVPEVARDVIRDEVWDTIGEWVVEHGQPIRLPLPVSGVMQADWLHRLTGGVHSVCTLFPIRAASDCQGVMGFLYEELNDVRQDWRQLGQTFADVLALTLRTQQQYHSAQQSAARQAQRAAQLGIVREISAILMDNLDLHEMLHDMGEQLETGFGYAGVTMWLQDRKAVCPSLVYASTACADWCHQVFGAGFPTQLQIEKRPDAQVLMAPIRIEGEMIGAIALRRLASDGGIVEFEVELIRMVLDALAVAVKKSQLYAEIKETKSYLENLINDAGDAIVTVNTVGDVTSWNASAERIFGYAREEIVNRKIWTIVPRQQYDMWEQTVFSQGVAQRLETPLLRRDGVTVDTSLTLSPLHGPRDEVVGFSAIIKDVTADKKLREHLIQAEKLRVLGEMAAGVAHNFNNALTTILGHTQLLMVNPNSSPSMQHGLGAIEKASLDAAEIVRRIQAFSQDHSLTPCQPISLPQVVQEAVEVTRPVWLQQGEKGKAIELRLLLNDVEPVLSRPSELREVLTNLILNAVDAMPNGGLITLRTLQQEGFGCIAVEDTGIGMNENVRRRIFDPFFSTKKTAGSGLGLSVSYTLIQSQGGDIEVASIVGKGTRFLVKLPQA